MDSFVAILREHKFRGNPRLVPLDKAPILLTHLHATESLQTDRNAHQAFV